MRKNWWAAVGLAFLVVFVSQNAAAQWTALTPSVVGGDLTPRRGVGMASVSMDKTIMFGGLYSTWLAETWLYDDSDNRWTKLSPAIVGGTLSARGFVGMSYIGEDRVLMFGGQYTSYYFKDETWLFDLSENKWTKLNPTIDGTGWSARGYTGMAYLGGDKVIMFGGYRYYNTYLNDTWLFDLSENKWTRMTPAETGGTLTIRQNMELSYISDGKVIGYGGRYGSTFYDETWIYDSTANTWTQMSPVVTGGALSARRAHGMSYIGSDKVIMFGGEIAANNIGENDAWIYDLSDNTWTLLSNNSGSAPPPRCFFGMAAVGTGKITVFGGYETSTNFNDTWTYQMDDFGASTVTATPAIGGIQVSWSVPSDVTGLSFTVYKNGQPISNLIEAGTVQGDNTVFTFFDDTAVSGTLNRYKVLEHFPLMNSEVFYPEITVPYCQ